MKSSTICVQCDNRNLEQWFIVDRRLHALQPTNSSTSEFRVPDEHESDTGSAWKEIQVLVVVAYATKCEGVLQERLSFTEADFWWRL